MRILWAIAWKEFLHVQRDPKTMAFIIVMPIMLLLIYGYGISFDIQDIGVSIVDYDHSITSRQFIDDLTANPYFNIRQYRTSANEAVEDLDRRISLVGVIIPRGFARDSADDNKPAQVQFLIDGSDGNTATIAMGYLTMLTNELNVKILKARLLNVPGMADRDIPPLEMRSRFLYNPELKSSNFIVPGIIAIILMLIGSVATALTIVREKESNTIEQLIVSQATAFQIIFGKLIPYIVLSFLAVIIVLLAAVFLFGIIIKGSILQLLLMTVIYLIGVLGIGIAISSIVNEMAPAMLFSLLFSLLPSVLLSGFVFAIRNMPEILQWLSMIVPARYFIIIIRGLILKGVGWEVLWPQLVFVTIFALLVFGIAIMRFKKRLD